MARAPSPGVGQGNCHRTRGTEFLGAMDSHGRWVRGSFFGRRGKSGLDSWASSNIGHELAMVKKLGDKFLAAGALKVAVTPATGCIAERLCDACMKNDWRTTKRL